MEKEKTFELDFAGKKLTVEVGKIVKQANASCTVRYGDTVVLATIAMAKEPRLGGDFFPLSVEVREKMYAAGKIKGSRFVKREGRPSDSATLDARMIDRGLRPLFNQQIRNEVQVVVTTLSYDQENCANIIGILAAGIVVHISDVPCAGPMVALRVARVEGEFVINPTVQQLEKADLNLVFSIYDGKVMMVDADGNEVDEDTLTKAFEFGLNESKKLADFVESIRKEVGKEKQDEAKLIEANYAGCEVSLEEKEAVFEEAKKYFAPHLEKYLFNQPVGTKRARKTIAKKMLNEFIDQLIEQEKPQEVIDYIKDNFELYLEDEASQAILEKDLRVDGRKLDEIRKLSSEVGYLPRTHGTGLFSRGETQVLSIVTLGSPGDVMIMDEMTENDTKKRYMHFYNSPPYAFGEPGAFRGAGRREIGHGALAEKALRPVLPSKEEFPYTIVVVSEVLGSNGSSSMASTCGSTLALFDAGVPLKKPVAGIAMGLASDGDNYKILTDLQDLEDGPGGMDFKVTGTRDGVTAIQMDTKTHGITLEICQKTLAQAKKARLEILDQMATTIDGPRENLSPYAPRIVTFMIDPEKIGELIGPGGKIINQIIDTCGVQMDIEDSGQVIVTGVGDEGVKKAVEWAKSVVKEPEVGEIYEGEVVRIMDFGAFVQILPGKDGLVHISELDDKRIDKVTDVVKIGDKVRVKVIKIDEKGRVNLSMKAAKPLQK